MNRDAIDEIAAQWRALRPALDVKPMATIGRLGRVCALGERLIEATLASFELSIGEFDVLATLGRSGAPHRLTPTQLYKTLMLTSGAMTNRLDRLEQRGLVTRVPDPSDRRGVLVCLTDAGLSTLDQAVDAHVANEARMLSVLSRAEQSQLDGVLRKLLASFEARLSDPSPDEPSARASGSPRAARKKPPRR